MKEALRRPFIYSIALVLCILTFTQCNGNQAKLKILAKAVNMTTPQDMGEGMTLVKVAAVGENEMKFYITAQGLTRDIVTPVLIKNIQNSLMEELVANKEVDEFRKMKTTISYEYQDMEGNTLIDIQLPHESYTIYTPVEITTYDQLQDIAHRSALSLPMTIDDHCRWDSIVAHEPNILKYRYTVNAAGEKAMKPESWKSMKNQMRKHMVSSPEVAVIRELGTEIRYVYYNEAGKELGAIIFQPEEYNN